MNRSGHPNGVSGTRYPGQKSVSKIVSIEVLDSQHQSDGDENVHPNNKHQQQPSHQQSNTKDTAKGYNKSYNSGLKNQNHLTTQQLKELFRADPNSFGQPLRQNHSTVPPPYSEMTHSAPEHHQAQQSLVYPNSHNSFTDNHNNAMNHISDASATDITNDTTDYGDDYIPPLNSIPKQYHAGVISDSQVAAIDDIINTSTSLFSFDMKPDTNKYTDINNINISNNDKNNDSMNDYDNEMIEGDDKKKPSILSQLELLDDDDLLVLMQKHEEQRMQIQEKAKMLTTDLKVGVNSGKNKKREKEKVIHEANSLNEDKDSREPHSTDPQTNIENTNSSRTNNALYTRSYIPKQSISLQPKFSAEMLLALSRPSTASELCTDFQKGFFKTFGDINKAAEGYIRQ